MYAYEISIFSYSCEGEYLHASELEEFLEFEQKVDRITV